MSTLEWEFTENENHNGLIVTVGDVIGAVDKYMVEASCEWFEEAIIIVRGWGETKEAAQKDAEHRICEVKERLSEP